MFELTPEQRRELAGPEPIQAIDPETQETYVLVRSAVYERLKSLLGAEDEN